MYQKGELNLVAGSVERLSIYKILQLPLHLVPLGKFNGDLRGELTLINISHETLFLEIINTL